MEFDKLLVTILGTGLIIFIYWFFFGKKDEIAVITDEGEIIVQGGYKPEVVQLSKGKTTKMTFLRRDPSSCLEEIVIPDFKVRKYLPLNEPITVEITPKKSGTYGMHCGMNMHHGKLIVD
jgi:plastocyanin domain-containing protein